MGASLGLAALASMALAPLQLASANPLPGPGGSHNWHNPYRQSLKREVINDPAQVDKMSYDFVIAGGGCAGLALAARLSEWSNVTVLLIEAGGSGDSVRDQIDIPGFSYLNGLTLSDYDWKYKTVKQTDSGDLEKNWPRGKGLGGSGAINGLYWNKGDEQEYDAWAQMNPNGEQTWNWAEMKKYMMKSETFHEPNTTRLNQFGAVVVSEDHGREGPIQTAWCGFIFDLLETWIPTWRALGVPPKDLGAGDTHGSTITPSTINPHNMSRSDAMAGYIKPLPPRPNLTILTGQQVTEVLFNGSTDASGNIVTSGVRFQAYAGARAYSVEAQKEVILAGGTVGSPQLLQLSGIGPAALLSRYGIKQNLDLPVGYNLQDHLTVSVYWNAPTDTQTWRPLLDNQQLRATELAKWRNNETSQFSYINNAMGYPNLADILNSSTSAASNYANLVAGQLDQNVRDQTSWYNLPDNVARGMRQQFDIMHSWLTGRIGQLEILFHLLGNNPNTLGIQCAIQHPWSRGTIMITSTDPFTDPAIDPHYFGMGYDIDIMQYGIDFARRLARTDPMAPHFLEENAPGAQFQGEGLHDYARQNAGTEYHPMGTCSMLPRDSGGVVDTNLMVYGAANLRVVDASIMPLQISAHLMASTYGIAEKAADIIKARYSHAAQNNGTATDKTDDDLATTARPGVATDSAVNAASTKGSAGSSPLSQAATIGIGVGAGVGGAILLAGLIAFFCFKKKKDAQQAGEKGWYEPAQGGQAGHAPADGRYREPDYAMDEMAAPMAPAFGSRKMSESGSLASMNMEEMAGREPLRSNSAYGLGNEVPYRDSTDGFSSGQQTPLGNGALPPGAGTPRNGPADFHPAGDVGGDDSYTSPSWTVRPQEQRYVPVNIR